MRKTWRWVHRNLFCQDRQALKHPELESAEQATGVTDRDGRNMATPEVSTNTMGVSQQSSRQSNSHPVFEVQVSGFSKDGGVHMDFLAADSVRSGDALTGNSEEAEPDDTEEQFEGGYFNESPVPPLAILMLVVGTRGDVQPFIALALKLVEYGHRVRLATHEFHHDFVTSFGVTWFPLGGDPMVLSEFIVRNRGIVPRSFKSGKNNIEQVRLIVESSYGAATEPDKDGTPFTAQAIIANPPTYSHVHIAEKLQIPCHIYFTMPWSPTRAFPSPLARFDVTAAPGIVIGLRNLASYYAVENFMYLGLRRIVRDLRKNLKLPKIRAASGVNAAHLIDYNKVPFAYCWSSGLVPKPEDWGSHIDVCGYFNLPEGKLTSYEPPDDLRDFLDAGDPPLYVGFGSLRVDDPEGLTRIIVGAAERTGFRVLLASGWAELGKGIDLPPSILTVGAVPHDWLLPQCAAVVHHGGAGTTAAGLSAACPTVVIYFFGDQPFWGGACFRRGVGPKPIDIDDLTEDNLTAALAVVIQPEVREICKEVAARLAEEDGVACGVDAFHRHLPQNVLLQPPAPVIWNLARPRQQSMLGKVLATGINILIRDPTRAAITGTLFTINQGSRTISSLGTGLSSVMTDLREGPEGGRKTSGEAVTCSNASDSEADSIADGVLEGDQNVSFCLVGERYSHGSSAVRQSKR